MAFLWQAYDDPYLVVFVSSFPHYIEEKKTLSEFDPVWLNFCGSAHEYPAYGTSRHVQTVKMQINLCIHTVWSES